MSRLSSSSFPDLSRIVSGSWAPIVLYPIIDSPEQFVIGVVASASRDIHIEPANKLERLSCLYERKARELFFAARLSLESFKEQILSDNNPSIDRLKSPASGVNWSDSCRRWAFCSTYCIFLDAIDLLSICGRSAGVRTFACFYTRSGIASAIAYGRRRAPW